MSAEIFSYKNAIIHVEKETNECYMPAPVLCNGRSLFKVVLIVCEARINSNDINKATEKSLQM